MEYSSWRERDWPNPKVGPQIQPACAVPVTGSPAVCGHRGVPSRERENTLDSFRLARRVGVDWIEFDVRPTADKVLVVHHDPMTSDGALIADLTCRGLPDHIPDLVSVMAEFDDLGLNIELKTDQCGIETDEYVSLLCESLGAVERLKTVMVTSFDIEVVAAIRRSCPDLKVGLLCDHSEEAALVSAAALRCTSFGPEHRLVSRDLVSRANEAGLEVLTWTVNEPADIERMAHAGVGMIIGDDPELIASVVATLRRSGG